MKKVLKSNLFFLMLLSVMFIGFTACSDDDAIADKVTGTYTGILEMDGYGVIAENVTIKVTKTSDSKVTLTLNQDLPNFGNFNISCPSVVGSEEVDNNGKTVTVYYSDGTSTWKDDLTVEVFGVYYQGKTNIEIAVETEPGVYAYLEFYNYSNN